MKSVQHSVKALIKCQVRSHGPILSARPTQREQVRAIERCQNWYLEVVEVVEEKKTRKVLYPRPALASFGQSPAQVPGRARGLLAFNNFIYGVNGTTFLFSLTPAGSFGLRHR